ncbi:hypothetical protein ZWY2020_027908 [Hordeum vulgare]|nr:hypothetical protein ZWY2020_027908 [Hordeum vulgare]
MQPEHVHRVDKLNPEVAWSFLQKMVASGDRDDHQFCKLREIGMEIVKKCDCSPLAIKTVAEDLKKRNKTRSAWLDELNNQKWSEKGLPAELYESIYISFDDLPPHLKQCFLYCCLFYEDEVINYDKLMHLTIREPENISSSSLARCAKLSEKRTLRSMWLYCTSSDAYEHSQEVYDELCPSPSLEDLTITGYFGRQLPVWLLSSDLENLRLLKLENLRSCTQLPCSFGQLPNLESLCIKHALSIRHIGVEFLDPTSTLVSDSDEEMDSLIGRHFASMATSTIVFPKLRKLVFYGMLQWKEWDWDAQLEAMHALRSLQISRCRLSHLPPGLATQTIKLRVITLEKAKDLISIENFSSVVELYLLSNSSLEKIANLPNLKKLRLICRFYSSVGCRLTATELLHFISLKDAALEWDNVRHIEQVEAYADGYEQTKRCSVLYTKKTASFVTYMSDSPVSAADESESSSEQQE